MTPSTAAPRRAPPADPPAPRVREVRAAGLPRRAVAAALDALPLAALLVGGWAAAGGGALLADAPWSPLDRAVDAFNARPGLAAAAAVAALGALVAWHAVFEVLMGGSPGKRAVGLRVVDRRGRRPGPVRAALHGVLRAAGLAAALLGWLWAFADVERRALHDRLAGLWVVRDGDGI